MRLPDGCVDAVVTDPPAGIAFMGRAFDSARGGRTAWVAWLAERLFECLRVAKPGARMLCWALPRTSHWTGCAVEDAGWTIEDKCYHVFGAGFPKAKSKLKPAVEEWVLARKPGGPVPELNIEACRVPGVVPATTRGNSLGRMNDDNWQESRTTFTPDAAGRYPAHLTHDASPEVLEAFAAFGERSGPRDTARRPGDGGGYQGVRTDDTDRLAFGDTGTAARFFAALPPRPDDLRIHYCPKASKADRGVGNAHPTVKNTTLMNWLIRLICPPGGLVLDPFCGSGSTGVAAVRGGFRFLGIDDDAEPGSVAIARKRIAESLGMTGLFAPPPVESIPTPPPPPTLF